MTVRQLVPVVGDCEPADLAEQLLGIESLPPFSDEAIAFAADLSRALARAGRGRPEIEAAAFWMRRAKLNRLAASFAELGTESSLLVPRGIVFHVPPANVDTLFVYSWLLAMLTGNRSIVRLSERSTDQAAIIFDAMRETMAHHPAIAARSAMVTYGHDRDVTQVFSDVCDVRVIWGGDRTVNEIRRISLPTHATELTFPDRFSLAAVRVDAYLALPAPDRDRVAEQFFNDAYWFDQRGCSSPRIVLWVGDRASAATAESEFFDRLRTVVDTKNYQVDGALAVAKLTQAYGEIMDHSIGSYRALGNEITVLGAVELPDVRGEFCGGGLFTSVSVPSLDELPSFVRRADQTLSQLGFTREELRDLAVRLNGKGIDRIVPMGSALDFNRFWDGYDLVQEFTRRVTVDAGRR